MERRFVISPALAAVLRHRVKASFLVALAHENARRLEGPGWRGVVSPDSSGRVAAALPGASPPVAPNWTVIALEAPRQGSWSRTDFIAMIGHVQGIAEAPGGVEIAPENRLEIARFIGRIFAPHSPAHAQLVYARALSQCPTMPLWAWYEGETPIAAMLLTTGAGVLGVHSLCVAPEYRGRGLGLRMLATAQRIAGSRPLALTCRESLVDWYRRAGLAEVGVLPLFRPRGR